MRTLWHGLVRIVFWSFERGTWPYDLAVAAIVAFVLLSPRSWFQDRPPAPLMETVATAARTPGVVELTSDPTGGSQMYRVDAKLIPSTESDPEDLQRKLHEAVRQNAKLLAYGTDFDIVHIAPVTGHDGTIAYYDVVVQPQE
jgi:hypothetical protein